MGEADTRTSAADHSAASRRNWRQAALKPVLVAATAVWVADTVAATYWQLLAVWLMVVVLMCLAGMCWLLRYTEERVAARRLAVQMAVVCLVLGLAVAVFGATVAPLWLA